RDAITAPPVIGALYVLGLAAWAGRRGSGDDAEIGDVRRAEAVATFIEHRFAGEITRMKIGIVATAIGLGLVIGLVAELLIRARGTWWQRRRRSILRVLVRNALVCAAVHAVIVMWSMADSPQLYAARWYAQGGLARTAQIVVTDVLGKGG